MQSNTVVIDRSVHPNKIIFSDQFNVAIPFIDRHLSEGRADKLCIITEKISWTYSDLATSVGKYANQLLAMDMVPGQRLLMAVTDGPEFIALFFGAIKAGVVPIAVNTMLRTSDYKFLIDDCKCTSTIWSKSVDSAMRPAISSSSHKPKTTSTLEDFINDAGSLLLDIGFLMKHTYKAKMTKIKKLLLRSEIRDDELALLRGIISQARWKIKNKND